MVQVCLLIGGLVWFCFVCFLPLLYVRIEQVKIRKHGTAEYSAIFFRSEWLIVKSCLCVAITEATDGAVVKTNG